jgi:hypothetical protein
LIDGSSSFILCSLVRTVCYVRTYYARYNDVIFYIYRAFCERTTFTLFGVDRLLSLRGLEKSLN